jgi:Ca2+/Na+ antiporter
MALGILAVLAAGRYLGRSAHALIIELGIPTWVIGWILGLVTSLPEAVSFCEIYRLEKARGRLHLRHDTQQGLDALVASNMSNLGIILPAGMLIYLLFR